MNPEARRLIEHGAEVFEDYELAALMLSLGRPYLSTREDAVDMAKVLLQRKGRLAALIASSEADLRGMGLKESEIFGFRFVREMSVRYLADKMKELPFCRTAREVYEFLHASMRDLKREQFKVIFIDPKNHVIEERTIFEGTVDSSVVYPREIMKMALDFSATALVFAHNHPSGDPEPSSCDREITKNLVFAAKVLGIRVLDHLIIGSSSYFSFADHGLISEYDLLYLSLSER